MSDKLIWPIAGTVTGTVVGADVGAGAGQVGWEYLRFVLTDLRYRRDGLGHTSVDLDWIIKRMEAAFAVGADVGAGSSGTPAKDV